MISFKISHYKHVATITTKQSSDLRWHRLYAVTNYSITPLLAWVIMTLWSKCTKISSIIIKWYHFLLPPPSKRNNGSTESWIGTNGSCLPEEEAASCKAPGRLSLFPTDVSLRWLITLVVCALIGREDNRCTIKDKGEMYGNRTHHDIVAVISNARVLLKLQQVAWQRKKFKKNLPLLKVECCQSKARQTAGLKK